MGKATRLRARPQLAPGTVLVALLAAAAWFAVLSRLDRMAGFALAEQFFARTGISRCKDVGKGNLDHLFAAGIVAARVDHVGRVMIFAVMLRLVIDEFREKAAKQEDQPSAAKATQDLRHCHCVEHIRSRPSVFARIYPLPLVAFKR